MAHNKATGQSKGVSRRELLQGAAAATVIAATGQIAAATCDTATADTKSYHALALWLALTTNSKLLLTCSQSEIEKALGLNAGDMGKGWKNVTDATPFGGGNPAPTSRSAMYDMVRTDFLDAITAVYGGADCPKSLAPIIAISKMYK
jgi:hypothetical protein